MTFSIALSGLNAASSELKVLGNNIANASTTGYKSSRAEFADVFAASAGGVSSTAIGSGVRLSDVAQEFAQGNIDFTSSNLDLAINGNGFFVLSDSGSQLYTRAGSFSVDRDGYVVNSSGQRLQTFAPIGTSSTNFNTGSLVDLQVSQAEGAPNATTTIGMNINLDASDGPPTNSPLDPTDPSTYNYSTSFSVFDSVGVEHSATVYFEKSATPLNWNASLYVDGTNVTHNGGSTSVPVVFNSNGSVATVNGSAATSLAFDSFAIAGASPLQMTVDFGGLTQYGGNYAVSSLTQDGYAKGKLSGLSVSSEGVISARYTNGQSNAIGKVALADFANTGALQEVGDTNWTETYASGQALVSEPGSGSLGLVQSGALESSNVDIAKELIGLITAQRNFQGNAQVISTESTITQTIINIR